VVCIKKIPIAWCTVFDEKIRQILHNGVLPTLLADPKPSSKHKCMVGTFFGDRFVKKEDGLRTLDGILPRIRGLKAFLYMAAENFELEKKI
jgi:hypothetical protein